MDLRDNDSVTGSIRSNKSTPTTPLHSSSSSYKEPYINLSCLPHTNISPDHFVVIAVHSLFSSPENDLPNVLQDQNISKILENQGHQHSIMKQGARFRIQALISGIGVPFHTTPISTIASSTLEKIDYSNCDQYGPLMTATYSCSWSQGGNILVLPVRYCDIKRDSCLHLKLMANRDEIVCETHFSMWDDKGRVKMGLQRVAFDLLNNYTQENVQEDKSDEKWEASCILDRLHKMKLERSKIEAELAQVHKEQNLSSRNTNQNVIPKVKKKVKVKSRYENREIESVPWLDQLMEKRCTEILEEDIRNDENGNELDVFAENLIDNQVHLVIELPECDIPIVYHENLYANANVGPIHGASGSVTSLDLARHYHEQQSSKNKTYRGKVLMPEPIQVPILQQSSVNNRRNIQDATKDIVKNHYNLVQFLDLENVDDNPVEDKYRTLQHELIRGLVDPGLKPDSQERSQLNAIINGTSQHLTSEEKDLFWKFRFSLVDNRKALTKFLMAVEWSVESEVVQAAELLEQWRKRSPIEVSDALKLLGKNVAFQTGLVRAYAIDTLSAAPDAELELYLLQLVQALKYEYQEEEHIGNGSNDDQKKRVTTSGTSSLGKFLIERAAGNIDLANNIYWYLRVETEDERHGKRYVNVFNALKERLTKVDFDSSGQGKKRTMWDILSAQDEFICNILECQKVSFNIKGNKDAKEEYLRDALKSPSCRSIRKGWDVPLPSNPSMWITGVKAESARMFKSAMYPSLLEFHLNNREKKDSTPATYKVIVKTGDDLRQDQLVIMLIKLFDRILKRGSLDLCLRPYPILAMSAVEQTGLVEFVEGSIPVSHILTNHNNSILAFFKSVAPQQGALYDVNPSVLETYIRSCAGYCVITYLIGVGDRHLENIMIQPSGHFFHIDFGFIFGRDPKPLPPKFRLTSEMIEGMGGFKSEGYKQFCSLACQSFNLLRKQAGLVLNLLHLMSDAGIQDLSNHPTLDAEGVIAQVEERFRLELSDEQAETYFIGLINECHSAFMPKLMDKFHDLAVAMR